MPEDKHPARSVADTSKSRDQDLLAKGQDTQADRELSPAEKRDLQGIAHGGETHGNAYGSGPGHPYADAAQADGDPKPGDSASNLASAQSTRKSRRARRQGVV